MIKYILIPEYKPLYAMKSVFGPEHGPLVKPCPTPVDVIGKLLLQRGNDRITIYEIGFDHTTRKPYGDPVRLTLSNYRTPYDELISKPTNEIIPGKTEVTRASANVTPIEPKKVDTESVSPQEKEVLVETIEEKIDSIPEVEPDEIDKQMIEEAEEVNKDSEATPMENIITDSNSTTVIKVNVDEQSSIPFTSGFIMPADEKINTEGSVTTVYDGNSTNHFVTVTTTDGAKLVDTGMSEEEYRNLSKSERRKLRKALADGIDVEDISKTTEENTSM